MESVRKEILPGVWLTALKSDKFKTACLSLTLLTQHNRENAAMNALIPFVLSRGTVRHPDMQSVSAELDALYGSSVEPVVRRIGEIQCIGFYASFPDARCLSQGEDVLRSVASLAGELLLSPNTRGGLLLPEYVESEKEKLLETIRGRVNAKRSYALMRLLEEMCCYEDFSVPRFGLESSAEGIHYRKLTRHYRSLLASSPLELFYCGSADFDELESVMTDALCAMPRGEIDYDIGTDIRMNAVEECVREFTEEMPVSQGKLVMGFRLGECMEEPDLPAIYVFNAVFGGGVTSKLFMNVRERLSLCYYASSLVDTHKGLLIADSGIDADKYDAVRTEILSQLEAIKNGNVTEAELSAAKRGVISDLLSTADSQGALEGFYLANAIDGIDCDPAALSELASEVTLNDVIAVARSTVLDAVYFLCPGSEEDSNEDQKI